MICHLIKKNLKFEYKRLFGLIFYIELYSIQSDLGPTSIN